MKIGITGTICSGKNEMSRILKQSYNYELFSFGDIARTYAHKIGIDNPTAEQLQKLTWEQFQDGRIPWMDQLEDQFWQHSYDPKGAKNAVIEGFCFPEQIEAFERKYGLNFLIGIDGDKSFRYKKFKDLREREGVPSSKEAFDHINAIDQFGYITNNKKGLNIKGCFGLADINIWNEHNGGSFLRQTDQLMRTIDEQERRYGHIVSRSYHIRKAQ